MEAEPVDSSPPTRVDIATTSQLDYWVRELDTNSSLLRKAIAHVGHDLARVKAFVDEETENIKRRSR